MHSEIQSIHQAQKKASALSIDKQHSGGGTGDNGAPSFLEWRFSRDFTDVCTAAWEERTDQKCLDFWGFVFPKQIIQKFPKRHQILLILT